MQLNFEKIHGLGNDFALVEDWDASLNVTASQVSYLCHRHFGIGADGLIFIRPSKIEECCAYMHYLNSDGTRAQMCGNGIRCMTKYLVDHGYVNADQDAIAIETLGGVKRIRIARTPEGAFAGATVDMGTPELDPNAIPAKCATNAVSDDGTAFVKELAAGSPWGEFAFTLVSMGNPHAVCFIDNWDSVPDQAFSDPSRKSLETLALDRLGEFYEHSPLFPEKANIEFAEVCELGIAMRVWERGCGETLACGTGACAVNVAAALTGRASRENDLMLPGGTLHIEWRDNGHVYMTGPAKTVYRGEIEL